MSLHRKSFPIQISLKQLIFTLNFKLLEKDGELLININNSNER